MITVREPAPQQIPQQSRLLDIDPMSQSLYSNQVFSYDKSSINSGSDLTYQAVGGNPRIKVNISGQGVMNLGKSALVFRYEPTGLASKAPIYASDITSLFEVEQFQINTTSILTGSSKSYLFNSIMRVLQGKNDKKNNWLMGSDASEMTISPAELEQNAGSVVAPSLQKKLYQRLQSGRIINCYRHYDFGSGPTSIQAPDRQMSNLYMVELGDIIPQIASMGSLAERFPLAFVNSIGITLRLVDPQINHCLAGHCFGDTTTSTLNKALLNYTISDVSLFKIESLFNGDQSKQQYAQLLLENKIAASYTDFELMSFDVTNSNQITATVPVALRDLRFVALAFTLKDAVLASYKTTPYLANEYDMFSTSFNHPWASGLHFYMPKIKDVFISINGQSRVPISQPQCLERSDFAPTFLRGCLKQLIGNSDAYDQNYFDQLAGQSNVLLIPWQREAFASQNISLADQSNLMQITVVFQAGQYQPSTNFNITNLQMNIFRVFDKQLQLGKMSALVF